MTSWGDAQREIHDRAMAEWSAILQRCGKPTELEQATVDELVRLAREDRLLSASASRDGFGSGCCFIHRVDPNNPAQSLRQSIGTHYFLVFSKPLNITDDQLRRINENPWEGWSDFQESMYGF